MASGNATGIGPRTPPAGTLRSCAERRQKYSAFDSLEIECFRLLGNRVLSIAEFRFRPESARRRLLAVTLHSFARKSQSQNFQVLLVAGLCPA